MNMYGRLFTLVTIDDDSRVFAWGMEIITHDSDCNDDLEAVIYRKDPNTGRTLFGVHDSAQAAADRWCSIIPVEVHWEESHVPVSSTTATDASPKSSSRDLPQPWGIDPPTRFDSAQPCVVTT